MLKRSQKQVSENSQSWYQDKYQHVLTQRNVLALIALIALGVPGVTAALKTAVLTTPVTADENLALRKLFF